MKTKFKFSTLLASLFLGALAVQAADTNQMSQPSGTSMREMSTAETTEQLRQIAQNPEQFIQHVNQINLAEIQQGQLAQQKGENQKVKNYAKQLVKDHQELQQKLETLASQKGIECTNKLDAKHQATIDRLSTLSGTQFDNQFFAEQKKGHKRAILLMEQATKSQDEQIKSFAQENLTHMRHHLQMAQAQSTAISEPAGTGSESGKDAGGVRESEEVQQHQGGNSH